MQDYIEMELKILPHTNQKKIALISDFTGFGKCSITVALPVISTLKVHCCPVPTSVFSNHTDYPEFFFEDYTDKMPSYIEQWKKLGLKFEGITTGFLGSARQIEIVGQFIRDFKQENTIVVVDPVMGDNGVVYSIFTEEMCRKIRVLVGMSNIITPNLTEACILTDRPYRENFDNEELHRMALELSAMGPEKVVMTGIVRGHQVSNYVYEKGKQAQLITTEKIGISRSGTGDIFSAVISADAVNSIDFAVSVKKAADFIGRCIVISDERNIPKEDGLCFEDVLTTLV